MPRVELSRDLPESPAKVTAGAVSVITGICGTTVDGFAIYCFLFPSGVMVPGNPQADCGRPVSSKRKTCMWLVISVDSQRSY